MKLMNLHKVMQLEGGKAVLSLVQSVSKEHLTHQRVRV